MIWFTEENDSLILYDFHMVDRSSYNSPVHLLMTIMKGRYELFSEELLMIGINIGDLLLNYCSKKCMEEIFI